jgi:hypothetical protein
MGSASGPTTSGGTQGSSTGEDVTCPDDTDLVVDRACYRHLELDDVRVWQMDNTAAVHLTGGPQAEVLVGTPTTDLGVVVVSLAGGVPQVVAELDQSATGGPLWGEHHWPPVALDVDADGRDEAVFGTFRGPVVYVVAWDPSTGGYAMTARDDVLPENTGHLMLAMDVDADDDPELIAVTVMTQYDTYLTVVDRVAGRWEQVGTTLFAPELYTDIDVLEVKAIAPDDGPAAKLGYIHDDEDFRDAGVTIVRVDEGYELVQEARLEVGFSVRDFTSGDFDANGYSDVYIGGYDSERQEWQNALYFFDGSDWSAPVSYPLGYSSVTRAADMSNDGVPDLLTVTTPTHVFDLGADRRFDLVEAAWPLALHDLNLDTLGDVIYRPRLYPVDSSAPTTLHFLLSLP